MDFSAVSLQARDQTQCASAYAQLPRQWHYARTAQRFCSWQRHVRREYLFECSAWRWVQTSWSGGGRSPRSSWQVLLRNGHALRMARCVVTSG